MSANDPEIEARVAALEEAMARYRVKSEADFAMLGVIVTELEEKAARLRAERLAREADAGTPRASARIISAGAYAVLGFAAALALTWGLR